MRGTEHAWRQSTREPGNIFLVLRWPDGDLTCVLTRDTDEFEFRTALGYERVSRARWLDAVDELRQRQHRHAQQDPKEAKAASGL